MRSIKMFAVVATAGLGVMSIANADVDRLGRGDAAINSTGSATAELASGDGAAIRSGQVAPVSEVLARRHLPAPSGAAATGMPVAGHHGGAVAAGRFASVDAFGRI
ncbi:MAG: hypothetical protein WDZ63_06445 [Burkholderiales bacterium]